MNKLITSALSIIGAFSLFFLIGCGGKTNSPSGDNSAAFDSIQAPVYSGYTAVAVTHTVKDFQQWLKVYNKDSDPNSRVSVYASPDDPNLITVFELTKSHSDAKNSFASDLLQREMKEAGVTSTPVYQFYDIKYRSSDKTDKAYRLGVSHVVSNYDNWKRVFDEDEQTRADAGLELRAISTNADDHQTVNVMFATDDIAKAKDLINSDELKKRMRQAGVRSDPVLTVLKVPKP